MNDDNFYKPIEFFEFMARQGIDLLTQGKEAGLDHSEKTKQEMVNLLRCSFLKGCQRGLIAAHVKDN